DPHRKTVSLRHGRFLPPLTRSFAVACRGTYSVSQFFDADHLRLCVNMTVALDGGEGVADRSLCGLMGDHNHVGRRAFMPAVEAGQLGARSALHDTLDRDPLLRHAACD